MTSSVMPITAVERKPSRLLAALAQFSWALPDQMLISATNFITIILLARILSQSALGTFWLVYSVLLFLNSVQCGIFTQPHNILGATRQGEEYRRYTTSTGFGQVLFAGLAAGLAVLAWLIAYAMQFEWASLLLALAPAIVAWQIQEYTRRVLYTEGRIAGAFATDLLTYGGQIAIIILLWKRQELTGASALGAVAAAAAVGGLLGLWLIRNSLCRHIDRAVLVENWHFGKWVVGGDIVGNWLSAQLLIYIAAGMLGAAAAGIIRAVQTVFGPARILSEMLYNILPIRFSRAFSSRGRDALHSQLVMAHLVAVPMLGAFCLLVAIFAEPILQLLYGDKYAGNGSVLALYGLSAFLSYLTVLIASGLRARRMTRDVFRGQFLASIISVPAGWLLIWLFGVHGAPLGMLVTFSIMAASFWFFYLRRTEVQPAVSDALSATRKDRPALQPEGPTASGLLLCRIFELLDRANVPWCITHGYEQYPHTIRSDVDCIMPAEFVNRQLASLLYDNHHLLRARVVQWINEETQYIVLAGIDDAGQPYHVRLDVSTDYTLRGRSFISATEVLSTRRRYGQFWVPSPAMEFACLLLRCIVKRRMDWGRTQRLCTLYAADPAGAAAHIGRFWTDESGAMIQAAAASGDWGPIVANLPRLRAQLLRRATFREPLAVAYRMVQRNVRRIHRWCNPPHGLHVICLGPDGAGKSSVVSAIREELAPAFFATRCRSFPPALLNRVPTDTNENPHDVKPRSPFMSVFRAVTYWFGYHTVGYLPTIHRERAQFFLVIHDRHLIDVVIDPRRYRYTGPVWLIRLMWGFIPKPDLVLVFDGPADVIQSRKREVPMDVTARQLKAYRALAAELPMARVLDAGQPLGSVITQAARAIHDCLALRTARQLGQERALEIREALGQLLERATEASSSRWLIRRFSWGDQADIRLATCAQTGGPAEGGHGEMVVKVFKPNIPELQATFRDEANSLQGLHDLLDGVNIDGWTIRSPLPLARCDELPALVMTRVPGDCLTQVVGTADPELLESIAPVVVQALGRFWSAQGRIYGDLDPDNVLCDPASRTVSLVDPGMPVQAHLCPEAPMEWFPASRDLAYLLFDVAASLKLRIRSPRRHRMLRHFAACALEAAMDQMAQPPRQQRFIDEIEACCQVHLRRLKFSWSLAGIYRMAVRAAAAWVIFRTLRELRRQRPAENACASPAVE